LKIKYKPKKNYQGLQEITFRSTWEYKSAIMYDADKRVESWGFETKRILYYNPVKHKEVRYLIDFHLVMKLSKGLRHILVEVKPKYFIIPPPKRLLTNNPQRYYKDLKNYSINYSKWSTAYKYALDNKMHFMILTKVNGRFVYFTMEELNIEAK